ncbi:hypothetical protein DPMN_053267 [Dreissena polymorpha]|uniref:Uncharacterized protein n=1 Tax=Dreissena polymorpha TaxID=45954 RepID=A0A9D4CL19_DREPO|nr:hypothetical protein DPMN_053267 [Dreissena polymorpha]
MAMIHHVRRQDRRIMHDEVHRDQINTDKNMFIKIIIKKFDRDPRHLHFLFMD